jgi:hypothetical protein
MTCFKVLLEVNGSKQKIAEYPKLGSCLNKIKKENAPNKRFFIQHPTGQIEEYMMR